jgi:hypothetical protein
MSTLSRILQICCILAITVGAHSVALAYVELHGLTQDDHSRRNGLAFLSAFGVGALTLGTFGLLTPWVNAIVFGHQWKPSGEENP